MRSMLGAAGREDREKCRLRMSSKIRVEFTLEKVLSKTLRTQSLEETLGSRD